VKRTLMCFASLCGGELHGADRAFEEVSIDTRKLKAGDLFVALPGAHVDGHSFVAAAAAAGAAGALLVRPLDVPLAQVLVDDAAAALARAASRWRVHFTGPVVGVAGSNGKTTVKEMLAAILALGGPCLATRGNLNNHLGVPLTLLRLSASDRSAVIEIGANRAGEVAALAELARPGIGLITNAGAEHLEGFGSLDGVARAEGEMVAVLAPSATAVINADDRYASLWQGMTRARVVRFGLHADADYRAHNVRTQVSTRGFRTLFDLHTPQGHCAIELALAGRHNVSNALAAAAAAMAAGATLPQVSAGLASMRAVSGRLQFRLTPSGAWLIDDSYNANPSSVRAALDVLQELPGRKWFVLGDMAELGEFAEASHRELGAYARARGVERLFAHGPLAALAAQEFGAGAARYADTETLAAALRAELAADTSVLIKGSRVNRLERVVEALGSAPDAHSGNPDARRAG
jgi:UDP-N-acetylmuramoyl-tripeptide--D-alanyl-D-alanine ligase